MNKIAPKINDIFEKENIDYKVPKLEEFDAKLEDIREKRILFGAEPQLLRLIFASSNILSFIKWGLVLSEATQNKFNSLSEEINSIKEQIGEIVYKNLIEAKDSLEMGCLLGSSLISGRIIRTSFDKIKGENIEEKIGNLKLSGLVREKDGKDSLLKANHYGRNLASHDLDIIPSASEAISFLAEAIKIAKITSEYQKNIQQNKEKESTKELDKKA